LFTPQIYLKVSCSVIQMTKLKSSAHFVNRGLLFLHCFFISAIVHPEKKMQK
jgi:hypothetical protein